MRRELEDPWERQNNNIFSDLWNGGAGDIRRPGGRQGLHAGLGAGKQTPVRLIQNRFTFENVMRRGCVIFH